MYQEVSVIDASGKLVLQKRDCQYNDPIDVSRLATGNYIITKDFKGNLLKNK